MSVDRLAAIVVTLVVAVSVVVGLWIAGSPHEQRLRRLDSTRVSDMRRLARAIDDYVTDESSMPDTLTQLVDGRRLSRLPSDPVTGIAYEYAEIDDEHYTLCAIFQTAADVPADDFWSHDVGRACFTFKANDERWVQGYY